MATPASWCVCVLLGAKHLRTCGAAYLHQLNDQRRFRVPVLSPNRSPRVLVCYRLDRGRATAVKRRLHKQHQHACRHWVKLFMNVIGTVYHIFLPLYILLPQCMSDCVLLSVYCIIPNDLCRTVYIRGRTSAVYISINNNIPFILNKN
jgi:hypothetical protein